MRQVMVAAAAELARRTAAQARSTAAVLMRRAMIETLVLRNVVR